MNPSQQRKNKKQVKANTKAKEQLKAMRDVSVNNMWMEPIGLAWLV